MKQTIKFFSLIIAFIPFFFISCSDDDDDKGKFGDPTITFDNANITLINGKLSNPISGSIIASEGGIIESATITIFHTVGEQTSSSIIAELKDLTPVNRSNKSKYTFHFDSNSPGIKENEEFLTGIKIHAKVMNGGTKDETRPITTSEYVDLSNPSPFIWTKNEDNNGTGLRSFGLEWLSNTTMEAIITPMDGFKLVKLEDSAWGTITKKEELKNAVNNTNGITEYSGVSILEEEQNYTEVIAVGSETTNTYYLIQITRSTVSNDSEGNSLITISGEQKN